MILILAAGLWLLALLVTLARRRVDDETWREAVTLGVIGAATAGFFWRLLFSANTWMPAGGGDLGQFLYPTYLFAAEWWRRGVVPLWNPNLFAGAPFVGDNQSGIFYPLNLLTFFVSYPLTYRDMEYLSVFHFALAGATMYAFLRFGNWGTRAASNGSALGETGVGRFGSNLSRPAALAGTVAFEFSDLFVTHFGNLNLIAVVAWMPLVLLLYRRAAADRRPGLAALAGVFLAVAFLAGHIQSFLFIVIALIFFALWRMAEDRTNVSTAGFGSARTVIARSYPLLLLAVTAAVAFGLSAPSLLPSVEMTQHTLRTTYTYEQAAQYSLPPAQLVGLFVPGFFGRGAQDAWGPWPRVEVGYIGVLPLLLALLALVLRRDSVAHGFAVFALLGLALALGGYAILQGWLYQGVPGFGQLRAPARFIVLLDFGIAALAAMGFDALLRTLSADVQAAFKRIVRVAPFVWLLIALSVGSSAYAILILGQNQDAVLFARMGTAVNALAFFLLLLALAFALIMERSLRLLDPAAWSALALALIFFDLLSLGAYVDLSTEDPSQVFNHPEAVAFLKSNVGLGRVDARGTGVDRTWPADASIVHGLYDIDGDNPLVLADFDRYWQSLGSRSTALYDLLDIQYLIGRKDVTLDRAKFHLAFDGDPAFDLFVNTQALPRAFVVAGVEVVPDQQAAFAAIHAAGFDPTQTVVLERATADDGLPIADRAPASASGAGDATITGYGPNEITLNVQAASDSVLFTSEVYYPGWRAWVDGQEAPVLRADYLFRAVQLPAGSHKVQLLYDPLSFKLGVGLFAVTLLGLVGWGVWGWRRQSRKPG